MHGMADDGELLGIGAVDGKGPAADDGGGGQVAAPPRRERLVGRIVG
jgi:hypothetical protein